MRTTIVKSGFVILAPLFWLPGLAQATTGYIDVRDAATNADLGLSPRLGIRLVNMVRSQIV